MCECLTTMCRRIWRFAESKSDNVMAYLQKSTVPKHWFYPTIITQGQMPTTDLVYTFSCTVSFRAGLCITELWAMWGRFNMIEKVMSLVWQASPFVPKGSLSGHIPEEIAKLADILGHSSIDTTRIYIMTTGTEHRRKIERLGLVV